MSRHSSGRYVQPVRRRCPQSVCSAFTVILAELAARECGHLSLDEALRLTALVALHARDRGGRYALRWLTRYLAEQPAAMLDTSPSVLLRTARPPLLDRPLPNVPTTR